MSLLFGLLDLEVLERVLVGHIILVAGDDNLAVLDEDGLVAVALHRVHRMRDQDDRLGRVLLHLREEVVALALERLVAHGEHLVEHEDVALRLDGDGEGETHLHAGGIVLELLVHEVLKFRELDDVVVHRVDLLAGEAEQRAVQVHVLAAGELRIEAHAQFDERHQFALDGHAALFGHVDLRDDLQQRGLAGTVASDDAEEVALTHLEADVLEHMLLGESLDALRPVEERHLQARGLFGGQAEVFRHMVDLEDDGTVVVRVSRVGRVVDGIVGHQSTSANLALYLRKTWTPSHSTSTDST